MSLDNDKEYKNMLVLLDAGLQNVKDIRESYNEDKRKSKITMSDVDRDEKLRKFYIDRPDEASKHLRKRTVIKSKVKRKTKKCRCK